MFGVFSTCSISYSSRRIRSTYPPNSIVRIRSIFHLKSITRNSHLFFHFFLWLGSSFTTSLCAYLDDHSFDYWTIYCGCVCGPGLVHSRLSNDALGLAGICAKGVVPSWIGLIMLFEVKVNLNV